MRENCIKAAAAALLSGAAACFRELLAPRKNFSNKGDYGYVALMGGCRGYSGAAKLSSLSLAALRSGCGVSMLAVPKCIAEAVTPYRLTWALTNIMEHVIISIWAM